MNNLPTYCNNNSLNSVSICHITYLSSLIILIYCLFFKNQTVITSSPSIPPFTHSHIPLLLPLKHMASNYCCTYNAQIYKENLLSLFSAACIMWFQDWSFEYWIASYGGTCSWGRLILPLSQAISCSNSLYVVGSFEISPFIVTCLFGVAIVQILFT